MLQKKRRQSYREFLIVILADDFTQINYIIIISFKSVVKSEEMINK